jgi:hypothetical protein
MSRRSPSLVFLAIAVFYFSSCSAFTILSPYSSYNALHRRNSLATSHTSTSSSTYYYRRAKLSPSRFALAPLWSTLADSSENSSSSNSADSSNSAATESFAASTTTSLSADDINSATRQQDSGDIDDYKNVAAFSSDVSATANGIKTMPSISNGLEDNMSLSDYGKLVSDNPEVSEDGVEISDGDEFAKMEKLLLEEASSARNPKHYWNNRINLGTSADEELSQESIDSFEAEWNALTPTEAIAKARYLAKQKNNEWMTETMHETYIKSQQEEQVKRGILTGTLKPGVCDPGIVEQIQPCLKVLGSITKLLSIDAENMIFRFHYYGLIRNKFGMECWTTKMIKDCGVTCSNVIFETGNRVRDKHDM